MPRIISPVKPDLLTNKYIVTGGLCMTKKTTTNFNIDRAISRIAKPSVFDRLVKEIDAKEIPSRYIEYILVQYYDGNIVELSGKELTHPIPVNKNATQESMESSYKKMRDIKIFISTDRLEEDINEKVEEILGKFC
jgi:hypothetical protein